MDETWFAEARADSPLKWVVYVLTVRYVVRKDNTSTVLVPTVRSHMMLCTPTRRKNVQVSMYWLTDWLYRPATTLQAVCSYFVQHSNIRTVPAAACVMRAYELQVIIKTRSIAWWLVVEDFFIFLFYFFEKLQSFLVSIEPSIHSPYWQCYIQGEPLYPSLVFFLSKIAL